MAADYLRVAAEIDLNAAAHNIQQIKKNVKQNTKIMAVIKADAYGHGALELAPVLLANGADMLGVAIMEEAIQLRRQHESVPILILGYTDPAQVEELIHYNITQTVFTYKMAEFISKTAAALNKPAKIHIKIDTGMGRIGFFPNEDAIECIQKIKLLPGIEIEGIFTHFASADEEDKSFTYKQIESFTAFTNKLLQRGIHIPIKHAANSACTLSVECGHFNMVRTGLALYGLNPFSYTSIPFIPLMSLKTRIVFVKEMEKDMTVSYGRTYKLTRPGKIATIPVGYADGYPRNLSSKGRVIIRGHYAPIAGRICMDQFMIDVTHIPEVQPGDEVTLMGSSQGLSIPAEEIAYLSDSVNYEVVCRVSKRVPRIYKRLN